MWVDFDQVELASIFFHFRLCSWTLHQQEASESSRMMSERHKKNTAAFSAEQPLTAISWCQCWWNLNLILGSLDTWVLMRIGDHHQLWIPLVDQSQHWWAPSSLHLSNLWDTEVVSISINHKDRCFPDSSTLHFDFEVILLARCPGCVCPGRSVYLGFFPRRFSWHAHTYTPGCLHCRPRRLPNAAHGIDFTRRPRGAAVIRQDVWVWDWKAVIWGVVFEFRGHLLGLWVSLCVQISQSFYLKELKHRVAWE